MYTADQRNPGHERFLLGQTATEMQACATEGTIVVVNMTEFRSDAILVSCRGMQAVALPELSRVGGKGMAQ